jgi:hypothetical protein
MSQAQKIMREELAKDRVEKERDAREFKARFCTRGQSFIFWLCWLLPRHLRPGLLVQNKRILAAVKWYRLSIQEAYREYQEAFNANEETNLRYGFFDINCRRREMIARKAAIALTEAADKELRKLGYRYAKLRTDLITGSYGWITVEPALRYWDQLEEFFANRVKRLE